MIRIMEKALKRFLDSVWLNINTMTPQQKVKLVTLLSEFYESWKDWKSFYLVYE